MGMEIAEELGVQKIEVRGDSQLVVKQMKGVYEVRKPDLIPYYQKAVEMSALFAKFDITYVSRSQNAQADALAGLAASLLFPDDQPLNLIICERRIMPPLNTVEAIAKGHKMMVNRISVHHIEEEDWRLPLIEYIREGVLPENVKERESIRRRAPKFFYNEETKVIYRRSFDVLLLRCLSKEEAQEVMNEVHSGLCGAHQPGPKLQNQIKRIGYYWPTMVKDCMELAQKCKKCQFHANFIHQPPEPLHPSVTSWPFEAWGMDIVGPISPPSSNGHRFIFAVTDYFSKWAEAAPFKEIKTSDILEFLRVNVICRFGVPQRFVHDNGPQF